MTGLAQPAISKLERGITNVFFSRMMPVLAALGLELVLRPRPIAGGGTDWWDQLGDE